MSLFRRPDRPCSDCDGTGELRWYAARPEAQWAYSNQVRRCAGCDGTGSEKVRRWKRAKRWNERADRWERESHQPPTSTEVVVTPPPRGGGSQANGTLMAQKIHNYL
jgi:hypothetical protein